MHQVEKDCCDKAKTNTELSRVAKLRMALAYRRTVGYLLFKKGGIRSVRNFFYTKTYIKHGEGGAGGNFPIHSFIRRFPALAPFPDNIEIEMTTKCSKRCIICEHTYWKGEPFEDLPFDKFKHIVDQFPHLKWCNLTGEGEFPRNKDWMKILKYQKSRRISTYFVDEFDAIDEQTAKELIDMGVDGIWISMDAATKETYEAIKVGCNFERTVTNIRNFVRMKEKMKSPIPEICFRFVITTMNYREIPQFIELVRSFGERKSLGDGSHINFVGLLAFDPIKHLFLPEVPEEILEEAMRKSKELDIPVTFSHSEVEELPPLERCTAWLEPYIMMGGYVVPCCGVMMSNNRDFLRKHALGNVFETSFKEIWNSERYKRFRRMLPDRTGKVPVLCARCRVYHTAEREGKYGVDANT